MADRHLPPPPPAPEDGHAAKEFDRELNVRSIVVFLVGLTIVMGLAALAMWLMFGGLKRAEQARDPQPLPLAEARARSVPPEPRLQASPERDLQAMRAEERQALSSFGWTDQARGIAHVPVAWAMERIVTSGLPDWPEPAPQAGTNAQ